MKHFCLFLATLLLVGVLPASAVEAQPTPIYTPQQLQAIAQDPSGSYILMADLDMTGIDWQGPDFSGIFDGNGHAILNLTVTTPGDTHCTAYDGNTRPYEPDYYGLFSCLTGATVKNLKLVNVRALVQTENPAFLAGLAGYMEGSTVDNCRISGTMELRAHHQIYGIAGVVGYGGGSITGCTVDVTLICVDTDMDTKREQFLGGVYATGFADVINCDIRLDGYISEGGYVHSGGITGMYYQYPFGMGLAGSMTGNHVTGKITFFENNSDRRAYCGPFAGETLLFYPPLPGTNTQDFLRDEVWNYDTLLRPELCDTPSYTQSVTPAGCDSYGYTTYTCGGCGYSYTDHYTLFAHALTRWEVSQAATQKAQGLETALCDVCGERFSRAIPPLVEQPSQPPQAQPTAPQPIPAPETPVQHPNWPVYLLTAALAIPVVILPVLLLKKPKKGGKYLK